MQRSSNSARIRAGALTIICAATLGIAACGGDDDETTSSTSTATEATSTTEETTTEDTSTTEDTTTEETTTEDGAGVEDIDVDALREQFNKQLLQVLTETQGLSKSQAQCAVDELQDTLTDEALQEAASTGQPPQDLLDAAFDAGVKCAG